MSFADLPAANLLAACGGDTVKLFDLMAEHDDPCTLSYTPEAGSQVNSVKWNHTNLVVASAGDDKKISLWHKNGHSLGIVPLYGSDAGDNIDESISAINFSNKGSRYLCSGGSGRIVRIWDLQRKRCIKWLSGHSDTITGVMYNYKDEHLASMSLKGDLILHNLASGAQVAELKDPNGQALRVLDYSRHSRHILVTAGDDGSIHLWDTNGRSAKASWLKQHSAPTTGVCFSPSNDKIIASVGLDKKLFTLDSGTKRPISCCPFVAPFSSLAFRDDGYMLAAGTNSGRVVFYDVRGKPEPVTVLLAYNSSEAVTSVCWQRSRPVVVNENSCTDETALLGGTGKDSILMPDPLPSVTGLSIASTTSMTTARGSFTSTTSGLMSTTTHMSIVEETPQRGHLMPGALAKLQPPRTSFDLKDDMDVFSPLVDVQPITPSLSSWRDDSDEVKKDGQPIEKKSSLFASITRRFPYSEGTTQPHAISDWRSLSSSSSSLQDDAPSTTVSQLGATPASSSSSESSLTPPDAWGGNAFPNKFTSRPQPVSSLSRFISTGSLSSSSVFAGLQDSCAPSGHSIRSSQTSPSLSSSNLQSKLTIGQEMPSGISEFSSAFPFSSAPLKFSTYAERTSTLSSFSNGTNAAIGSPKVKKTGAETREEIMNSLSRRQTSAAMAKGSLPETNGVPSQLQQDLVQSTDQQLGYSSFSLQLVQHTLEETLGSLQMSIHQDVRNLHIELLRQFHMHEMEMSNVLQSVLEKQDELMKEVQALRRENQQLRQLL